MRTAVREADVQIYAIGIFEPLPGADALPKNSPGSDF